ncbi:MAG: TerB family tellurite resistance protein [Flavobacteriales bacterium]
MQNTHQIPPSLTPGTCFVASMFYLMMVDGEIDPEEMGYLSTVLGGKRIEGKGFHLEPSDVIDNAMSIVKNHSASEFLKQMNEKKILNNDQKLFTLTHMISLSYSDGQHEPNENKMLAAFTASFSVPQEHLIPVYHMLKFKYNKAIVGL